MIIIPSPRQIPCNWANQDPTSDQSHKKPRHFTYRKLKRKPQADYLNKLVETGSRKVRDKLLLGFLEVPDAVGLVVGDDSSSMSSNCFQRLCCNWSSCRHWAQERMGHGPQIGRIPICMSSDPGDRRGHYSSSRLNAPPG
jgi:hypothetical protein